MIIVETLKELPIESWQRIGVEYHARDGSQTYVLGIGQNRFYAKVLRPDGSQSDALHITTKGPPSELQRLYQRIVSETRINV